MTVLTVALRLPYTIDVHQEPNQQPQTFQSRSEPEPYQAGKDPHDSKILLRNPGVGSSASKAPIDTGNAEFFAQRTVSSEQDSPSQRQRRGSDSFHDDRTPENFEEPFRRIPPNFVTSRIAAHEGWVVREDEKGNQGLTNAVIAAGQAGNAVDVTWVGTLGIATDALEDSAEKVDIDDCLQHEHECLVVYCKDKVFEGHYNNYCKRILWPVFHSQIPDNPRDKAYQDHSWSDYVQVNQLFADRIIRSWKNGDIVWIHDYHLLLVPSMTRRKLPNANIGFFFHAAFPSSEVFRCLADRDQLLNGLLGANLIGFQTQEHSDHFLQTCHRLKCLDATKDGIQLKDRFVNVINIPIGIDPATLSRKRGHKSIEKWTYLLKERYRGKRLIVARDKLDPIRGLKQKLLSYELFLASNPEWRDKTVLIQITTSTTKQTELNNAVSEIATRINASFGTLAHQPLIILNQDISHHQYLALLAVADSLLITSLREGMNLISHEFVFSQDGVIPGSKKHGVLILSEFTGSSSVFQGADLPINPWNHRQVSNCIKNSLEMDDKEKERKWQIMHDRVMKQDARTWFARFIEKLKSVSVEQHNQELVSVPRLSMKLLTADYVRTARRLFMVDYEGALAVWGSVSNTVFTNQQRTVDILNELVEDTSNAVYVFSGRKREDLDQLLHRVPRIGLVAENGCFLQKIGTKEWIGLADEEQTTSGKKGVWPVLKYYSERISGSWLEELHCSIVLHYDSADDVAYAKRQAGECASQINDLRSTDRGMHAVPVHRAIVVEPVEWNRQTAAIRIFESLHKDHPVDFMMVVGDAQEDEMIFRWGNDLGKREIVQHSYTVSIGKRQTEALATLGGVSGVLSTLQKLGALSKKEAIAKTPT